LTTGVYDVATGALSTFMWFYVGTIFLPIPSARRVIPAAEATSRENPRYRVTHGEGPHITSRPERS
jgi:hypothetical protein